MDNEIWQYPTTATQTLQENTPPSFVSATFSYMDLCFNATSPQMQNTAKRFPLNISTFIEYIKMWRIVFYGRLFINVLSDSSGNKTLIIGITVGVLLAVFAIVAFLIMRFGLYFYTHSNYFSSLLCFSTYRFGISIVVLPKIECVRAYECIDDYFQDNKTNLLRKIDFSFHAFFSLGDRGHPDISHTSSPRQLPQNLNKRL